MLEYSWALTGIVGLSLLGWVIDWTSWRVPFFLLAIGLAVMWWVFGQMPEMKKSEVRSQESGVSRHTGNRLMTSDTGLLTFFDLGENGRSAYASILAGGFNYFAASQLMIMYGAWLNDQYGLAAGRLGTVALVLGIFDLLLGSVLVSLFADRIGKRNSVMIGSAISVIGYCLIPFLNVGIVPAVLGMALSRGAFEFAIVSKISLLSEQSPRQRGKTMTLSGAIWQLWGALAGLTAPWLYSHWQIQGIVWVSAVCAACAVVITFWSVREYEEREEGGTGNNQQSTVDDATPIG